jgi:hypothetical protein
VKLLAVLVLVGAAACTSVSTGSTPTLTPGDTSPAATAPATSPAPTAEGNGTGVPQPTATPTATLPAATPTSTAGPVRAMAVLVDLFAGGNSYNVALVGADGTVVARTQAAKRSVINDASELPYVMTSSSRVYYLDGDHDVRYLKPDGTTGLAASVPGSATVHATFAVSPDDARIAVALLDYGVSPVQLTLYVEDLGGAHHSVIFTSNSHYVWPVAWHAGQLVVAYLGPGATPFKSKVYFYSNRDLTNYPYGPDPYGGINFHVINPVTAQREVIISGGGASGLLTRAGTAVVQGDGVDWQGQAILWNSPQDYGTFSAAGSLSPDGQVIAACCPQPGESGQLVLWYRDGQIRDLPVIVTSIDWVGWLDASHLVTGFYQSSDGTPSVVDLNSNAVTRVDAHGFVAAILPGDLDS